MYHMKNILCFEKEIILPKCMYSLKNHIEVSENITDINISEQKMPNNYLLDLEQRQDKLLHKLDILYERIKTISSLCKLKNQEEPTKKAVTNVQPEEIVIILNHDNLPWFLNIFLKTGNINVSWHIHSTVPHEKLLKIQNFFTQYENLYTLKPDIKINFRLIFKNTAISKLKKSSLGVPILGTVNIIRYLCLTYNDIVPYDHTNHVIDSLLDIFYQLENSSDKNKQNAISKLFSNTVNWLYFNKFSIVDLAAFDLVKQLPTGYKHISKQWLCECEKIML